MQLPTRLIVALTLFGLSLPAFAQKAGETPVDASPPAPPAVAEVPQSSVSERVKFLLSGYEYFPTRADLDAVGSSAEISGLLRGFATDPDARPSLRLRAVDALGYYDDDETVALLAGLCSSEPKADLPRRALRTAGLIRHHAITSLARVKRGDAIPTLEKVLAVKDTQLTLTVVHALAKHGGKEGRAVLSRLKNESDDATVRREAHKWVK